jgi:hypothetical protein
MVLRVWAPIQKKEEGSCLGVSHVFKDPDHRVVVAPSHLAAMSARGGQRPIGRHTLHEARGERAHVT